ncbi:MAG: hypothetical protein V3T17_07715 [Pseudomonadales bacterium]
MKHYKKRLVLFLIILLGQLSGCSGGGSDAEDSDVNVNSNPGMIVSDTVITSESLPENPEPIIAPPITLPGNLDPVLPPSINDVSIKWKAPTEREDGAP